jgi:transcriptional regulator with XRE-family HTH domain
MSHVKRLESWVNKSCGLVGNGQDVVGFARFNLGLMGERMRYVRRLKRLTQKGIAAQIGCSWRTVIHWEQMTKMPGLNMLAHWSDICDTTIPYLLGYEGYDEPLRVFTGEIPLRKVGKEDRAEGKKAKVPSNFPRGKKSSL